MQSDMKFSRCIIFRALCLPFFMLLLASCREEITGEYPKDFPEECVVAYDMRRDLWDARENSKRIQRFWWKDTEQGRKDRADAIAAFSNFKKTKDFMDRIRKNCKMSISGLKPMIEDARRADSMSYEEFKEVYGNATKEELDAIFAR